MKRALYMSYSGKNYLLSVMRIKRNALAIMSLLQRGLRVMNWEMEIILLSSKRLLNARTSFVLFIMREIAFLVMRLAVRI